MCTWQLHYFPKRAASTLYIKTSLGSDTGLSDLLYSRPINFQDFLIGVDYVERAESSGYSGDPSSPEWYWIGVVSPTLSEMHYRQ